MLCGMLGVLLTIPRRSPHILIIPSIDTPNRTRYVVNVHRHRLHHRCVHCRDGFGAADMGAIERLLWPETGVPG